MIQPNLGPYLLDKRRGALGALVALVGRKELRFG